MKRSILLLAALGAFVACSEKENPEETQQPVEKTEYDFTITVKSSENKSVEGATVSLFANASSEKQIQSKTSDKAGKVVFKKLKVGRYAAKAVSGESKGEMEINVTKDEAKNFAELKLVAPEKPAAPKYEYKVTLKTHKGQPLPNHVVELSGADKKVIAKETSNEKGELVFKQIEAGKYALDVLDIQGQKTAAPATEIAVVAETAKNATEIKVEAYLHDADVIIIGALVDPRGADCPKNGQKSYDLVHPGTYEYIQLIATKDIDFSKTPYAVVAGMCSTDPNDGTYGTTGKGWVESIGKNTKTTYQMNLTKGSVKAGQIFYVGGTSQMIASYFTSKEERNGWLSPRIEDSRWWAFDFYYKRGANDNGREKGGSGLFNNLNSDKKGNVPDGIAVFNTTQIDENTVPVDCVFYGGESEPRKEDKFMICDNDLYSTVGDDGAEQKHFAEGSNTWFMKQLTEHHDKGAFFMMGGTWCKGEWLVRRVGKAMMLNMEAGPEAVKVADIETAEGVTKIILK